MNRTLTEMAAEIVAARASREEMSPEELNEALTKSFEALRSLKIMEESTVQKPAPALKPEQSIQRNKVVCLECGAEFRQLTRRHLREHNLEPREYRRKWGFSARQPLAARSLSAKRSKTAKELSLGERLQKARKARAEAAPGKPVGKKRAPGRRRRAAAAPAAS